MSGASSVTHATHRDLCIPRLLEPTAERIAAGIAIAAPGRVPLTYGRLHLFVREVHNALNQMGIGRNDRVAVVVPNGPEMAAAFIAVAASATCVPLNPAYRSREFDYYLTDLHPKALIVQSGLESSAGAVARQRGIALIELQADSTAPAGLFTLSGTMHRGAADGEFARPRDTAVVLYTSGTTARPKKVPLTHENLCTSACTIAGSLELHNEDCCLNVMPLHHIHGLVGALLPTLVAGASIVCSSGFDEAAFFAWLEMFRPSWYTAVPTIHQAILSHAGEFTDVIQQYPFRFIRSCSAPLPPQVMVELERVFNAPVIEAYGMTEASHQISSNRLPPLVRKPGSVGVPTGCSVAVMDEAGNLLPTGAFGEIVIQGPNVVRGYEDNLEANSTSWINGWFRTGDQGVLDADNYLFIKGRLKEIINRGGAKISPREIEEVLLDYPGVAQVAVFGVPHSALGEDIAVAVVMRKDTTATEADIRQFATTRLADFRVPSRMVIVDDLPKGATGKLHRAQLADRFAPMLNSPFVVPCTPLEREMVRTWEAVLGVERVGIDDNFFELGGTSLSAVRMLAEVQKITGRNLPTSTLLLAPTVRHLVPAIQQAAGTSWSPAMASAPQQDAACSPPGASLVAIQAGGSRPPLFCAHGRSGHVTEYYLLAQHLGPDQPVYGFQARAVDGVHPPHTRLEDMAAEYVEALRGFVPQGPYLLCGNSAAGLLAWEIAQQLNAQGQRVALLALLDTALYVNPALVPERVPALRSFLRRIEGHIDTLQRLSPRDRIAYVPQRLKERWRSRANAGFPSSNTNAESRDPLPPAPELPPDLPPVLEALWRAYHAAVQTYLPRPYPGPVTLFAVRELWCDVHRDPRFPGRLAPGPVEIHKMRGRHGTLVQEPHVRALAEALRKCIDRVILPTHVM